MAIDLLKSKTLIDRGFPSWLRARHNRLTLSSCLRKQLSNRNLSVGGLILTGSIKETDSCCIKTIRWRKLSNNTEGEEEEEEAQTRRFLLSKYVCAIGSSFILVGWAHRRLHFVADCTAEILELSAIGVNEKRLQHRIVNQVMATAWEYKSNDGRKWTKEMRIIATLGSASVGFS